MSYESTVTSKGQIAIPKELRQKFQFRKGERVFSFRSTKG